MKNFIKLSLVLVIISFISGLSLSWFDAIFAGKIKENTEKEIDRAITRVLPETAAKVKLQSLPEEIKKYTVYRCFDKDSKLSGYAVVASGNGFQGKIEIMAGVSPGFDTIKNIYILSEIETPGLGSRIEDKTFAAKFRDKVVSQMTPVKGVPQAAGEIDVITGATISSKSVIRILKADLETLAKYKIGELN